MSAHNIQIAAKFARVGPRFFETAVIGTPFGVRLTRPLISEKRMSLMVTQEEAGKLLMFCRCCQTAFPDARIGISPTLV